MTTWDDLRADWINGNMQSVRHFLKKCPKKQLFQILAACLENAHDTEKDDGPKRIRTDIRDLREMIVNVMKYEY